jgi:hypothetical protein
MTKHFCLGSAFAKCELYLRGVKLLEGMKRAPTSAGFSALSISNNVLNEFTTESYCPQALEPLEFDGFLKLLEEPFPQRL